MIRHATKLGAAALATLALAACGSSTGSSNAPGVSFNVATKAGATAAAQGNVALAMTPETFTDGTNTLVIESVQLVLRDIELKAAGESMTCAEADATASTSDDCEELKLGPILFDVPLGSGAQRAFTAQVPPGTYGELELKIHKPESSDDAAFLAAHPDFAGVSIKVTGTYNGTAFTYTTDLDKEQEHELVPPITVDATGTANLTLFLDLDSWFRTAPGGSLVDPASANKGQPNEGLVKNNIEQSVEAFEDENRDGRED